ncbi:TfoX/Sxy family protein [Rhodoplanes sp. Z2-YC6860]|uniref:TfoX/Sxy family protein n=1 Tax=Rhodoplanes sp. Z2-YC6860 TaxID=674703 RepID=UPI00078D2BC1|nr:TfoX/Sxy family protein [Rhodoplanes sp. Z2-YC6860]AMN42774.1 TfoX domain-containing protein [Rhodoplanes sp. Z2-YC6860]
MSGADSEYLAELFAGFGPVSVRRMFSGAGVFADGLMIALVVDGVIFLKADEETIPQFEGEGQSPFSYQRKGGRRTIMSYWRMPERLYDDPDELAVWARRSMAVAQRSGAKARRPKSILKKPALKKKSAAKKSARKPTRKRR